MPVGEPASLAEEGHSVGTSGPGPHSEQGAGNDVSSSVSSIV